MLMTTDDDARREKLWALATNLAFDWYLSVSPTMNYEKSKDPLYDLVSMIENLLEKTYQSAKTDCK